MRSNLRVAILLHSIIALTAYGADTPFNADSLFELIEKNQVTSVDQLLPLLPENLRSNYSLVYASRSTAQEASRAIPRIILFSDDGKFQMAVSGDSTGKGGNMVEMISQQADGTFQQATAELSATGLRKTLNPESCVKCHGSQRRPIWDNYPFWPGTYGGDHELLKNIPDPKSQWLNEENVAFVKSAEYLETEKFIREKSNTGRYANLVNFGKKTYSGLADLNLRFSDSLVKSYSKFLAKRLILTKAFGPYRRWFIDRASRSNNFKVSPADGYDFRELNEKIFKDYAKIEAARARENKEYFKSLNDRFMKFSPEMDRRVPMKTFEMFREEGWAMLETISRAIGNTENLFDSGIQMTPYYEGGRSLAGHELYVNTMEELIERDPEFAKHVKITPTKYNAPIYSISEEGKKMLYDKNYEVPGTSCIRNSLKELSRH
jgi:hypothetical protein